VSEYTVSVQVSKMLAKLDVGSAGALVALLAKC
jgi:DNA-binding CsgD family transcriptional regulator